MQGDRVLQDIGGQIQALRQRADQIAAALIALNAEREQWRSGEARRTLDLAKTRLDLLAAEAVTSRFDAADRRARELLAARDEALRKVEAQIQQAEERLLACEQARRLAATARDSAHGALAERLEQVRDQVSTDPAYQSLQEAQRQAAAMAERARQKSRTAADDREIKRRPYEADRLFAYLWARQFGMPAYAQTGLVALGDAYVARQIGYEPAARNFRMLLALADHLAEHAESEAARAESLQERLAQFEREALAGAGVSMLEPAATASESALAERDRELQAAESERDARLAARAALVAGQDPFSQEAMSLLAAQIGREAVSELRADAAETASAADDALVQAVADARQQYEGLAPKLAELEREQQAVLKQMAEAEQLRVKFRQASYDRSDSRFDEALVVGQVLQGLFRGAVRVNDAWREIERHHRRAPAPDRRRGERDRSRGGSSSGGFGGGGFGTGGGFGGGDFTSGGGF